MKRITCGLSLALVVAALGASVPAANADETERPTSVDDRIQAYAVPGGVAFLPRGVRFVPGRVLVRFRAAAAPSARATALAAAGASDVLASYDLVPNLRLVRLASGRSVPAAIAALSNRAEVEYATPDYEVAPAVVPNDPSFSQQWGMTTIGAPTAWNRTKGSASVKVAVLDTGIDLTHPDLAANVWTNTQETPGDGIDNDNNGFIDDVHGWDFVNNDNDPSDDAGHGTHVSGIIGAVGNNSTGVAGVNWKVGIMPLKICSASSCTVSGEIAALDYAVEKSAKVVNSSFGGALPENQAEKDAITAAGAAGVLDVAAAGNNGSDNDVVPFYPASYQLDNLLSVAATTSTGELASFSNFGASAVHLAAPGQDVFSTYLAGGYTSLSGTSMASPHVAGAAALLWAQHPSWTRQQVRSRLIATVQPLSSLAGNVASCGQLDLARATDTSFGDRGLVCAKRIGTGGGSVASSPAGVSCGSTCVAGFAPGTSVTLTAAAEAGSTFVGWRGPCSGTGACTVPATGAVTATAIFRRPGSPVGWTQAPLPRPAARDPFFPNYSRDMSFYNVSLSDNGTVRARTIFNPGPMSGGSTLCDYDTTDSGGVFLSRKTASGWIDDGVLKAPAVGSGGTAHWPNCNSFGSVTELSGDGTRLLVSQSMAQFGFDDYRCAAFVYHRGASGWTLEDTLFPPGIGPAGSTTWDGCGYFGIGGAISRDGSRIAVVGHNGHVYVDVFVRGSSGWAHEARLNADACGDAIAPRFVAMSGDGTRVLAGDPWCETGTPYLGGRVHAFTRSGSTWTKTQTLNPPENVDRLQFGSSIAISDGGTTAAIAAEAGTAYVYERDAAGWHMSRKLTPPGDALLRCPAVVRAGARILCGSYETVGFNGRQGALYVFDRPAGGWAASVPQRAYATDGLAGDLLSRAGSHGWQSFGATEQGTLIDATIAAGNIGLGYYPHDRIGYEFTTPDPLGKVAFAPTFVRNASQGNALSFVYTAAAPLSGGTLSLTVPSGWSAPSSTGPNAGYTTGSQGTRTISGRSILVSGLTLAKGQTVTIVYGSKAAGGPGATAPSAGGDQTWPASVRLSPSEALVPLIAPPVMRVLAPDGSGTMKTSTTSVPHGATGQTLTFTYTAAAGGLAGGTVTLVVPSGWSAPSTTGTSLGYTKASTGTVSIATRTITVSGVSLVGGQQLIVTYGSKAAGGPGASAPPTAANQTWTAAERSSAGGALKQLASSPVISVS